MVETSDSKLYEFTRKQLGVTCETMKKQLNEIKKEQLLESKILLVSKTINEILTDYLMVRTIMQMEKEEEEKSEKEEFDKLH